MERQVLGSASWSVYDVDDDDDDDDDDNDGDDDYDDDGDDDVVTLPFRVSLFIHFPRFPERQPKEHSRKYPGSKVNTSIKINPN